jgi:hypothetical protein
MMVMLAATGPTEYVCLSPHLRIETNPISETLHFLVFRIPYDGQHP